MESNYSMTQYQTSFTIHNCPGNKVGPHLIRLIWEWIVKKETRVWDKVSKRFLDVEGLSTEKRYVPFLADRVFAKDKKGWHLFRDGAFRPYNDWGQGKGCRIHTTHCFQTDNLLWAVQYYEKDDNLDILTDIGINQSRSDIVPSETVFSIKVSFRPKNALADFEPTVPGIIKDIFRAQDYHFCDTDAPDNYSQKPIRIELKRDGKRLVEYICSPNRKASVLLAVVSQQDPKEAQKAISMLAERLLGKVLVYVVMEGTDAYNEIKEARDDFENVFHLTIRTLYLFHPIAATDKRVENEKYSLGELEISANNNARDINNEVEKNVSPLFTKLLTHIYRQHLVYQDKAVSFDDVQAALENSIREKKKQAEKELEKLKNAKKDAEKELERAGDKKDIARLTQVVNDLAKKLDVAENALVDAENDAQNSKKQAQKVQEEFNKYIDGFDGDNNRLKKRAEELSSQLEEGQRELNSLKKGINEDVFKLLWGLSNAKKSLNEKVEAIRPFYADAIILSEKAQKDLSDNDNMTFDVFLKFLYALKMRLLPAYQTSGSIGARMEDCVKDLAVSYSPNENANTMSNPKLRDMRTVVYQGEQHVCEAHLKVSTNDYRAYIKYLPNQKKILVGRIGIHLETAGSKRKGF